MKKKMVLVTGGAGYVGSVLTKKLVREGFRVKVFDKFYFGKDVLNPIKGHVELEEGDIRSITSGSLTNVKAIIHLAALSNDPTAEFNPQANKKINTEASIRLAKLAKKCGVERFIFASTCSIYNEGLGNDGKVSDEKTKVFPTAPYSLSKYEAEEGLLPLADSNFNVTVLRKGTIHGISPRMRYDLVVNTMIKNALNQKIIKVFCKGMQWRPIMDISDVTEAYFKVLTGISRKVNGEIFNIAYTNVQIKDLALIVQKILLKKFDLETQVIFEQDEKKDRSYRVSTAKAEQVLGFFPKVSIENSVFRIAREIVKGHYTDFTNPSYYNIQWMEPILKKESRTET